MTRNAAVTVRRPGLSRVPVTSTRTWFQFDAVKQLKNGYGATIWMKSAANRIRMSEVAA
jgi:hypothetical protein